MWDSHVYTPVVDSVRFPYLYIYNYNVEEGRVLIRRKRGPKFSGCSVEEFSPDLCFELHLPHLLITGLLLLLISPIAPLSSCRHHQMSGPKQTCTSRILWYQLPWWMLQLMASTMPSAMASIPPFTWPLLIWIGIQIPIQISTNSVDPVHMAQCAGVVTMCWHCVINNVIL